MDNILRMYTDGAAEGNPGPGGYGTILDFNGKRKELSEGYYYTTNNRMELMAVIKGLEALKRTNLKIIIYSDSKYIVDSVEKKWVFGWLKKGFKGKKNEDLWRMYLDLNKLHEISFHWIKGHAGHFENERCDQLAVAAAKRPTQKDSWYEANKDKA